MTLVEQVPMERQRLADRPAVLSTQQHQLLSGDFLVSCTGKIAGMSPESNPTQDRNAGRRARRVDAARNRAALVATARRLFDERGIDVPLDEIAKSAALANATLYRHFPTRAELIVAVYATELEELRQASENLLDRRDPGQALADWLRLFVHHVATKRELALALPDDTERGALFTSWHATMQDAASQLLKRAHDAGTVRADITTTDILALASGIALTGLPGTRLDTLLDLVRDGYQAAPAPPAEIQPSSPTRPPAS
jgi:AcrR family transcriptional regulator